MARRPLASKLIAVSPKNTASPLIFHFLPQIPTKVHDSDFGSECQARQRLRFEIRFLLHTKGVAALRPQCGFLGARKFSPRRGGQGKAGLGPAPAQRPLRGSPRIQPVLTGPIIQHFPVLDGPDIRAGFQRVGGEGMEENEALDPVQVGTLRIMAILA